MKHDITAYLNYMDTETIAALLKIYNLTYRHVAIRLNCTRPNISYHMKNDTFKPFEREMILRLFLERGLEFAELVIINKLITTSKKVNTL
ncbi:hypothetical protein [Niallia taxi]|uniref:hypothetical protein n=1 Tax=Niallia taxi TaxID=2499688 RepID=UPI002E1DA3E4|nr:hypothetical protein [Niallia taxi]